MKQRADGRYEAKVYIGIEVGKKKYKTVYGKTQKEVKQKIAELKVEMGKGVDVKSDMSFCTWADKYLAVQFENRQRNIILRYALAQNSSRYISAKQQLIKYILPRLRPRFANSLKTTREHIKKHRKRP